MFCNVPPEIARVPLVERSIRSVFSSTPSPNVSAIPSPIWTVSLFVNVPPVPGSITELLATESKSALVAFALVRLPPDRVSVPVFSKFATLIAWFSVDPSASCRNVPSPSNDPANVTDAPLFAINTPSTVVFETVSTGSEGGAVSEIETVVAVPTVSSVRSRSFRNSIVPPPVRVFVPSSPSVPSPTFDKEPEMSKLLPAVDNVPEFSVSISNAPPLNTMAP